MLERASACFNAGARRSLRCSQKASRSKRKLHSTFWNHGAGDLDLPPWVTAMYPTPIDLPLKHDNTPHGRIAQKREDFSTSAGLEGPFLDFLYPPQALAWAQRTNGQVLERWESRNARRLPEGFVQASRGHSARSFTNSATRVARSEPQVTAPSDAEEEEHQKVKRVQAQEAEEVDWDPTYTIVGEADDVVDNDFESDNPWAHPVSSETVYTPMDKQEKSSSETFAEFPADLAEMESYEPGAASIAAPRRLRYLLSAKNVATDVGVSNEVWTLYMSLTEGERNDSRLMTELLKWFARIDRPAADARCISLYWSIPPDEKTLETYYAAMGAFLRLGHLDSASALHKEAIQNIKNGVQVSSALFEYAVQQKLWPLALEVYRDHHAVSDDHQERIFWLNVSRIPNLVAHVSHLVTRVWFKWPKKSDFQEYRDMGLKLSIEAINESLRSNSDSRASLGGDRTQRSNLRSLFDNVLRSDNPMSFIEQTIVEILRRAEGPPIYERWHHVVSWLYMRYRKMTKNDPPEQLFVLFIERILQYDMGSQTLRRSTHSITLEMLLKDYKQYYSRLDRNTISRMISAYALRGDVEHTFTYQQYLEAEYPDFSDYKDSLWAQIYVNARRADIDAARNAFDMARDKARRNGAELDLKCWNVLLYAHTRIHDYDGALDIFNRLSTIATLTPNAYTYHSIANMLADRGDVEKVETLLDQYDAVTMEKRHTSLLGSHLIALVKSDQMARAVSVLESALPQSRSGQLLGSLTGSFNIILMAHAKRRDTDATLSSYMWMRRENIRPDGYTYAALIQALVYARKAGAASKLLKHGMVEQGFKPAAFHFSLVMAGHLRQREVGAAIRLHGVMRAANIRESVSSQRLYRQAKATYELNERRSRPYGINEYAGAPVSEVIAELRKILQGDDDSAKAVKEPSFGADDPELGWAVTPYMESLLLLYGPQKCTHAIEGIFREQTPKGSTRGYPGQALPIHLLMALMSIHLREKRYPEVETCWKLAKAHSDIIAPLVPPSDFQQHKSSSTEQGEDLLSLESTSANEIDHAAIGFTTTALQASTDNQILRPTAPVSDAPASEPGPTRRHILSRPLSYYTRALAAQDRVSEAISAVARLLKQGYTIDNSTWNSFIILLCDTSPPLVLLAFVLTERFLIPHFPGWDTDSDRVPTRHARIQGMQHIRTGALRPGQLMPRYGTLVRLGGALLQLRRLEASGSVHGSASPGGELDKYVGTLRQIRRTAAKTLLAVQTMPTVDDPAQNEFLRSS